MADRAAKALLALLCLFPKPHGIQERFVQRVHGIASISGQILVSQRSYVLRLAPR